MATKKQKASLKKAHRVVKCLKTKYGHKNKNGVRVGPKRATLKQKANCGSKSAKAALKGKR